jgi:hypothetical protein
MISDVQNAEVCLPDCVIQAGDAREDDKRDKVGYTAL